MYDAYFERVLRVQEGPWLESWRICGEYCHRIMISNEIYVLQGNYGRPGGKGLGEYVVPKIPLQEGSFDAKLSHE